LPRIEELVPHRGTALLLDRLLEFQEECAIAEYTPRADAWYRDDCGDMPGWFGIELMAQAVAAHAAMKKRRVGLPPKLGVLLGTRSYESRVKSFASGSALRVHAREAFRDVSGLAGYDCAIEANGETIATATLKVYEPEDFESFMQGSLS
jgi:predicted hotdog family 3-hydroxylacyl-ACP dehydratase